MCPEHISVSVRIRELRAGDPGLIPGQATYFCFRCAYSRKAVLSY